MKAIVTGGSGFVGTHLINHLSNENAYEKVIILDLVPPTEEFQEVTTDVKFIQCDIRKPIDPPPLQELGCDEDTVIYNLAAICRIPGFPEIDYFRTNIKGAENVCQLAEELGCRRMVFTSSVSPYGASEDLKTEESIPQPKDPYGSSKLVAEYIHKGWQLKEPENRMLSILRPGIIYGEGEQANFTRLYESQKKGFFAYPGRKDTKKACVYVKDVARACYHFSKKRQGQHLYNLVYEEAPAIEKICLTLADQTDARKPLLLIPGPLLIFAAYCIMILGKLIGKEFNGIHPDRVRKVMISTNISGKKLSESDFQLQYNLKEGIKDWYSDCNGKLA
ncbi:NAD(P)-dependent oxidoreductase [Aliifodinibius sp. S!AR15-10]|uniref:NAD-dependent epimerase/dehydratase family protein n=1 Tax=Aliifodinibius sp. S!AR15-10 TaxID=2950437 RepID=UPI00285E0490|nr:NAD(P)-dependent oxidoreductase [Aliifodinibius sp. S!AR15-10]MDR8393486.1 NAD(P)-dependent oxidoreductase [Aliifodinibius sp. S!AR15-10]